MLPFKMFFSQQPQVTDDRYEKLVKIKCERTKVSITTRHPYITTSANFTDPLVENHPKGYPRTAAYIDSDVDTVLFRRFGTSHARALLYMQVELTELEARLAKLDEDDTAKEETEWKVANSIHHKNGRKNDDRKALVDEFTEKLMAYGMTLLFCPVIVPD